MAALPDMNSDPTLEMMFKIMEENEAKQPRRAYLGASSIGDDCERKLWYGYNGYPRRPIDAKGIMAIEDGHRSENLIADRLRLVPGIHLWTLDDEGRQFGFSKYDDRFKGHADGVILGLLQAPKTPAVWENKSCAEKNFNKFKSAIEDYGEKDALRNWNITYFGQAQTLMHELELTRHYLTVCLSGGRDVISCRTEFNPAYADGLDKKAVRVINAKSPPVRISKDPAFYKCKFCDHTETCHRREV